MYVRKVTKVSEEIILVQEHGPGRYGAPGEKRGKRENKTPEAVKENNRKQRAEKIQLAILGNFMGNGHHIVLGYPKGGAPETYEEAEKNLTGFLEGIKRICKKMGYEFRYIGATERGKRTAVLHHHLIIQDINEPDLNLLSLIEHKWKGKRVHSTATYEDDTMGRQLADYIVKSIDKDDLPQGKYHISRNLSKPEVRRELLFGQMEEPAPPRGYQIVPDTLFMATNPWTGWPYQKYFLRSLNIKKNSRIPESNRAFEEFETKKTAMEAAKGLFEKVKNVLSQNKTKVSETVDNEKPSDDGNGGHKGKDKKPAKQNKTELSETVEKTVENMNTDHKGISEIKDTAFQNKTAASHISEKIKPLWEKVTGIFRKTKS